MRELGLDRLSEDGRYLVARDPSTGESFRIPADHRLSSLIDASSRRVRSRQSGQLEITMESTLSPRDIQARIRRGESTLEVAEAAGVPIEQILGFATPVLAEREYIAEQARKTVIRRKHVGGAGSLLGSLVDEAISEDGGVPEDATWDAWRREDLRWTVIVTPAGAPQAAAFVFDVKGRYVLPADELAHRLVGDIAHPDANDMAIADALVAPDHEVTVEVADPTPPADVTAAVEPAVEVEPSAAVWSLKEVRDRKALEQLALDDEPEIQALAEPEYDYAQPERAAVNEEPRAPKKKHERRRVPSWDEIMFGGPQG